MLRNIEYISVYNFRDLIEFLKLNLNRDGFCSSDVGTLKHDSGHGSFFYEPYNSLFKSICLVHENNKVIGISLIGDFQLTISDLITLYGNYREYYSNRDCQYFYFFNEVEMDPLITIRSSMALSIESKIQILNFTWQR